MAYKTKFNPINTSKYAGNVKNIICRSLWERKVCKYLDENKNVLQWGSEELIIPYVSPVDNKAHRYYPDFIAEIRTKDGDVKTFVIEVKPEKQTKKPQKKKKSKRTFLSEVKTYAVNEAKWIAANKYCEEKGWHFKIVTEKTLNIR